MQVQHRLCEQSDFIRVECKCISIEGERVGLDLVSTSEASQEIDLYLEVQLQRKAELVLHPVPEVVDH